MTTIFKSVFFPVKKSEEGEFPLGLRPSSFGPGCVISIEIDNSPTIDEGVSYAIVLNSLMVEESKLPFVRKAMKLQDIVNGTVTLGLKQYVSIEAAHYGIERLGTEADKRLLEIRMKSFKESIDAPIPFTYLEYQDLKEILNFGPMTATEAFKECRQAFFDDLTRLEIPYEVTE